jgi:hypothetical protein
VVLVQDLATGQTSTGNGMAEGLGLRLSGRGGYQGCLGFGGRCGAGEQLDLLADGAAEVLEGLLDVGRVIVGLVGVVGAAGKFWSAVGSSRQVGGVNKRHGQQLLVSLLEGIHSLLEIDVVGGELSLRGARIWCQCEVLISIKPSWPNTRQSNAPCHQPGRAAPW